MSVSPEPTQRDKPTQVAGPTARWRVAVSTMLAPTTCFACGHLGINGNRAVWRAVFG